MPEPTIRSATPADVPALHALVESAYRGASARGGWTHEADLLEGQRTDPDALAAIVADSGYRILITMGADGPEGCVQIGRGDGVAATLGLLTVSPGRQAGGLGRRLIAAAEATAAGDFGARRVEMTVIRQRAELIAWYERRGYSCTGETRPFPHDDARFGLPVQHDLAFVVLARDLPSS